MHYIPGNLRVRPHQAKLCQDFWCLVEKLFVAIFWTLRIFIQLFLSDSFKCLMFFTNLHFSSMINRSWMTVTNRWCIVSLYPSHQYCFCAATKILCVLRGASKFYIFLQFLCHLQYYDDVCKPTYKKWIYITDKTLWFSRAVLHHLSQFL